MRIKAKAYGEFEKMLLGYFEEYASDTLVEKINAGKKSFGGCWNFITREAKKAAKGNCVCIPDEQVFGWATHYFEEDDVKELKTGVQARIAVPAGLMPKKQMNEAKDQKPEGYIDLSDFL